MANNNKITMEDVLKEYFGESYRMGISEMGEGEKSAAPAGSTGDTSDKTSKKYLDITKTYEKIVAPIAKSISTAGTFIYGDYIKVFRDLEAGLQGNNNAEQQQPSQEQQPQENKEQQQQGSEG